MRIGITLRVTDANRYKETRDALSHDWVDYINEILPQSLLIPIPNNLLFNDQWLFYSASTAAMTKHLDNQPVVKPCGLTFSVSQDEESTQLSVELNGKSIDLGVRTHHYLLLLLARTRIEDKNEGVELDEQGWLYREELVKALGIQMNHMNIMVHRARKQLADAGAQDYPELAYLLETNNGRVRLNSQDITIIKGSKLETRITI